MALTAREPVPPAMAGPVTDKLLERLIRIAADAREGRLREDDGAFFLAAAPGCFEELMQWRRRASCAVSLLEPGNVVMFPGAGA